jgi:hypothetical protein
MGVSLFASPFVFMGFGLLSAPLWTYWKSIRIVYVITNRRVITFTGGGTSTIRSFFPERLRNFYRKEKKDGTGDVIIDYLAWKDSDDDQRTRELVFFGVRDPKTTESKLRKLAGQADVGKQPSAGV